MFPAQRIPSLISAFLLAAVATSSAQVSVYPGGDGTTTTQRGVELCGTDPASLNVVDGVNFSVTSGSEFAQKARIVVGGVPNPMGRDTAAVSGPVFGMAVANPTTAPLEVTEIRFNTTTPDRLFRGITPILPAAGWSFADDWVGWNGSVIVPALSASDFTVRVRPGDNDIVDTEVTLRAVTSAGTLTEVGVFTTTTVRNDNTPAVSLYFVNAGVPSFVGTSTNGGAVDTGASRSFQLVLEESEDGNSQPIPAGSPVRVVIPAGWSSVSLNPSSLFTLLTINQPTNCNPGDIRMVTTTNLRGGTSMLTFQAWAPTTPRSVSLFTFEATVDNVGVSPVIATRAQYVIEVRPPLVSGTPTGIAGETSYAISALPMGERNVGVFGGVFANPSTETVTITRVHIDERTPAGLFRSILPIRPASGWVRNDASHITWSGSLELPPATGADFLTLIQGNSTLGSSALDITFVTSAGSFVSRDGYAQQASGAYASLHYVADGGPRGYLPGAINGTSKVFTIAVHESEGGLIPAGSVLTIEIPARWSTVAASATQTGFETPVIVQPTPSTAGSITVSTTAEVSRNQIRFKFSATAPGNVKQSLFAFPASLDTASGVEVATCQAVVQTVELDDGGMVLRHISPPVTDPVVTHIGVVVEASAVPANKQFIYQIQNSRTAQWEALTVTELTDTPRRLVFSVHDDIADYIDGADRIGVRVASSGRECHQLSQDQLLYVVSSYGVTGTSLAPTLAFPTQPMVPIEALRFHAADGSVGIRSVTLRGTGHTPSNDIALVHLVDDPECDGVLVGGELEHGALPLDINGEVTFSAAPTELFIVDVGNDHCVIATADIAAGATRDNLVGLEIIDGYAITTDQIAAPAPSMSGYPIESQFAAIGGLDADFDGIEDADELVGCSNERDADSDDDGLNDGLELLLGTNPCAADSDLDLLPDGLERGVGAFIDAAADDDNDETPNEVDPAPNDNTITGTDRTVFIPDLDPTTTTLPLDIDSDDDGIEDGAEDLDVNGRADFVLGGTGTSGSGETDPTDIDTDDDGCQDGTEQGVFIPTVDTGPLFQPDLDPGSLTDPLDFDHDDDGQSDGTEDSNCNGTIDTGETDPTTADLGPYVLRNDERIDLDRSSIPAFIDVFVGTGANSLDPIGSGTPTLGEGPSASDVGSTDDDDLYALAGSVPFVDSDPTVVTDSGRPLVFYQLESLTPLPPIQLVKQGAQLEIHW